MRCVLDPGDSIVDCPPTFTMYVFDAAVNDARVVTVPRLEGFRLDVEGANLAARAAQAHANACWLKRVLYSHHMHMLQQQRSARVLRARATSEADVVLCRGGGSGQAAQTKDRVPDITQQPRRQHHRRGTCMLGTAHRGV